MHKRIFAPATVAAVVLSTAISAASAAVPVAGGPPGLAAGYGDMVHQAAVVCSYWGCAPAGRVRHYRRWNWDLPWGYAERPACPLGYYFACRRGPLGYGACACWPYRRY